MFFFLGSQDNSGGKVPQEVSSPSSSSKQVQLRGQTTLTQGYVQSGLKDLEDRDGTTSLGNLFSWETAFLGG